MTMERKCSAAATSVFVVLVLPCFYFFIELREDERVANTRMRVYCRQLTDMTYLEGKSSDLYQPV